MVQRSCLALQGLAAKVEAVGSKFAMATVISAQGM